MRTSKSIRSLNFSLPNNDNSNSSFKKKKWFYLLLFTFTIGLMYGSIMLKSTSDNIFPILETIQKAFTKSKADNSFISNTLSSFTSSILFLFIVFLSGFSAIGQPVGFITLFIKGLGLGSCISYFYLTYSFQGLLYVLVIIVPSMLITLLALILSAKESIKLSNLIFSTFTSENSVTITTLKLYIIKHLVLVIFLIASSILDGLFAILFADIFKF